MEVAKTKFKKNTGRKYKQMIYGLSVVFLFFISSRLVFNTPKEHEDTPLRKAIAFNNLEAEITNKKFFKDKNLLKVGLIIKENNSDIPSNIDVNIKEKSEQDKTFKSEVIKVVDEYYVIFIPDLPKKWQSVSIDIINKNITQSSATLNNKLYISNENSEKKDNFSKENLNFYEAEYVGFLIEDTQKEIKDINKSIKESEEEIVMIEEKISTQKSKLDYQTEKEKEETNQSINEKNSKINSIKENISNKKNEIKELNNRVENLKLKLSSLEKK